MKSLFCLAGLSLLILLTAACKECTEDADCESGQFCQFEVGECEGEGHCIKLGEHCINGPVVGEPRVCGCDNVTYDNDCLRREQGVSKLHELACE